MVERVLPVEVCKKREKGSMEYVAVEKELREGVHEVHEKKGDEDRGETRGELHVPCVRGEERKRNKETGKRQGEGEDKEQG